jgi:D-beta-D-heptose 7-phosphate kinase/D-beta-D-heptose 1-phosphate adenosyltransferase
VEIDFSRVKVLVVGDLMLDRYWWGTVDRISPEAPVPVVRLNRTTTALGGAANVAANVTALGAGVSLLGAVGNDKSADELYELLDRSAIGREFIVVADDGRPTCVKTRVIAHSQQVVRVDQETCQPLGSRTETEVKEKLSALVEKADIVLISDYAKGLLSDAIVSEVIQLGRQENKTVLVDPKGRNYGKYSRATILTPNVKEAADASGRPIIDFASLENAAREIIDRIGLEAIVITRGDEGMTLFYSNGEHYHVDARSRQVYDVTGAGDTVIATLAVCLGAGFDLRDAVSIANAAAGVVVSEVGTTVIVKEKLTNELARSTPLASLQTTRNAFS